jgi:hypothetical protein
MAMKKPAKEVLDDIKAFDEFRALIFPEGNIPASAEVQDRILSKTNTIKDSVLANIFDKGVPEIPILENQEAVNEGYVSQETFDFYKNKFKPLFSEKFAEGAKKITTVLGNTNKIKNKIRTSFKEYDNQNFLELDFDEVNNKLKRLGANQASFRTAAIAPLEVSVDNIGSGSPSVAKVKETKLPEGEIPTKGVLKAMLAGIGEIPDLSLRYAALLSILGYRGEDLINMKVDREEAVGATTGSTTRAYYDAETGTIVAPKKLRGRGKKGLPPDAIPGPVFSQVIRKAHALALDKNTSAIFDGISTTNITDALTTDVFDKISESDIAKIGRKLTDYTDMRRIIAAIIANEFDQEGIASEIIGHKSATKVDSSFDKVLRDHYVRLKDKNIEARKGALFGFEAMLANVAGVNDSLKLGKLLNLELPENVKSVYPTKESFTVDATPTIMPTSPEEVAEAKEVAKANTEAVVAQKQAEKASFDKQAAQDLVETQRLTKEAAKNTEEFVANQLKIEGALEAKKQQDKETKDKASKEAKVQAGKSNLQSIFDDSPDIDTTKKVRVSVDNIDPETGRKFTPAKVAALTAAGTLFVTSSAQAQDLVQDVATETALEGTAAALLRSAPKAVARAGPFAVTSAVLPTSDTNMPEIQNFARQNVEKRFFTDPSMTARPIYRDDPRLSDTDLFRKSALPTSDIGLKARRLETKRRDVAPPVKYDSNKLANLLSQGKRDITPGFVTPPDRSELKDITDQQLKSNNFLGR